MKLVFDVDTGVDDALALLFALGHSAAEVLGIGTVAGNVDVDRGTVNSLRVLEVAGRPDVAVARGCDRPLLQPFHDAGRVHGHDGLGGAAGQAPGLRASGEHAVDQLLRLAATHGAELTVVAVGPLTNLAVAVRRQPSLATTLGRLVVMGGAVACPGNVSPLAEFNFWADPDAARIVLEAGFPLTLVPLDVTMQAWLTEEHLASLGAGPKATFVRAITASYLNGYASRHGHRAAAMHDPLAAAIALEPSLARHAPNLPITVESSGTGSRGLTVTDRRPGQRPDAPTGRASVCLQADVERFFQLFLPCLRD